MVKNRKLVQDWVNSSPAGNIADFANELSVHVSDSIAQSNKAPAIRASSAEILNLHLFDLNKHGQVGGYFNITVKRSEDAGNRNLVIHNAHVETNIIQRQQQPQITPPSPPVNFGMPAQINARNTAERCLKLPCNSMACSWTTN